MNKFSEIINESQSFEELEDHFIPIYDTLGQPSISNLKFGDKQGHIFKWNLNFEIENYNGKKEIADILKIFECIKTISQSTKSILDFDVEFKIQSGSLYVRLTPQSNDSDAEYKFIVKQEWRQIVIDYGQVAKFFRDKGYSIKNTRIEDNEYEETSAVYIITDAPDYITSKFEDLFLSEFNYEYIDEESINRRISCTAEGNMVYIFPEEEKTFVVFNQEV
jgi:hypothetical protein